MLTHEELMRRLDGLNAETQAFLKDHAAKTQAKMEELQSRCQTLEQKAARRGDGGTDASKTWGQSLIESPEFAAFAKTKSGRARIEVNAAITSLTTSGGGLVPTDERLDAIMLPRRRLRIRDLISQGQTQSNGVKFVKQTGRTLNVEAVSEGTTKPESALSWAPETADVATIATWIPCSKAILDDAPALASLADAELRYGIALELEQQILLGDGSGENFNGIIPQATAYSAPFQPEAMQRIDAILLAQAQLEALEFEANGVVLNSQDWARIRSTKDANGNYMAGGPLTGAPRQLWDLPVVSSNSITAGHFLVGDFKRAAVLFERQEVTVEVSTEGAPASIGDLFTKNMAVIRAEMRAALAVQVPEALIYGTFQVST